MKVLTEEGEALLLSSIPERMSVKRHFAVLDIEEKDFRFAPLMFLEVFRASTVTVAIGKHRVRLPTDHSILVYDRDLGLIEAVSLGDCRQFDALGFNPLRGSIPEAAPISLYYDRTQREWALPKMPPRCALAVPVGRTCLYITKAKRWPETQMGDLLG